MPIFDLTEQAEFQAEKFKKKNLFSSSRMFFDIYCLEPGQEQRVHQHSGNDKIYLVVEGAVQVTLGNEQGSLQRNQAAVAAAGVAHGISNLSGKRAIVAVVMAPNTIEKLEN